MYISYLIKSRLFLVHQMSSTIWEGKQIHICTKSFVVFSTFHAEGILLHNDTWKWYSFLSAGISPLPPLQYSAAKWKVKVAFVTDASGISAVDVSDPMSPTHVTTIRTPGSTTTSSTLCQIHKRHCHQHARWWCCWCRERISWIWHLMPWCNGFSPLKKYKYTYHRVTI